MVRRILSPLISYFVYQWLFLSMLSKHRKQWIWEKAAEYMSVYGKENFMNELKKKWTVL